MNNMIFETKRLILRNFTPEDLNDLQEIFGDPEVMRNCEPALSLEKTREFLTSFCIGRKSAVAAVLKTTGKVIGYILFKPFGEKDDEDVYELGWIFNKGYWRQGYAYEACSRLVDYAFENRNAHKLFAEAIDPVKSVGLMEKLGFVREGVQRSHTGDNFGGWADLYLYGMLREDWEHHKADDRKEHDYAGEKAEI